MEQRPSWEADSYSASQKNSLPFTEPEGSLPCSQETITQVFDSDSGSESLPQYKFCTSNSAKDKSLKNYSQHVNIIYRRTEGHNVRRNGGSTPRIPCTRWRRVVGLTLQLLYPRAKTRGLCRPQSQSGYTRSEEEIHLPLSNAGRPAGSFSLPWLYCLKTP
jgi:hypothetical protein